MPVFEAPLFYATNRQLAELIQIIAAVNDARFDERRGFGWHVEFIRGLARLVNGISRCRASASLCRSSPGRREIATRFVGLGRFLQNDFEAAELVALQAVFDVFLRLFDNRFFERMRLKSDFNSDHGSEGSKETESRRQASIRTNLRIRPGKSAGGDIRRYIGSAARALIAADGSDC